MFKLNKTLLTASMVRSSCSGGCGDCSYIYEYQRPHYSSGDLVVASMFNIHESGQTPFSVCGEIRKYGGFQMAFAFQFAIDRVNKGKGPVKLQNVTLGALVSDSCSDALRAEEIVLGLHSGKLETSSDTGKKVNPGSIVGWLTSEPGDDHSQKMNQVLSGFNIVQMSSDVTSKADRIINSFPTIQTVAMAIASLLTEMRWGFIHIVQGYGARAEESSSIFRQSTEKLQFCSVDLFQIGKDGKIKDLFVKLKNSETKVTVLFVNPEELFEILAEKQKHDDKIVLIVAGTMSYPPDINSQLNSTVDVLYVNPNVTHLSQIDTYLNDITPGASATSLFNEYYQYTYQCNIGSNTKYNKPCNTVNKLTDADSFTQDIHVTPTVNNVFAFTTALHEVLVDVCGVDYSGVCEEFMSDSERHKKISEKMKNMYYRDVNGDVKMIHDGSPKLAINITGVSRW